MSSKIILCLLTLAIVVSTQSFDVKPGSVPHPASVPKGHVPLGVVKLHPPGNVTVGYIGTYNIYIYWYEPENYHLSIPFVMNISDNVQEITAGKHLTVINKTATEKKSIWPNMTYHVVTSKPEQETSTTRETNVTSAADWIGHEWVPFHKAHLTSYIVTWKENGTDTNSSQQALFINETEYHLKGLKAGTTYQISVTAFYASFTNLKSKDISVTTLQSLNDTADTKPSCYCDPYGTVDGGKKCHHIEKHPRLIVPLCKCRPGHSGLFCEKCQSTFFRTQKNHPCYACPCNKTVSTEVCDFNEDKLSCLKCREGYAGKLCERCASGYFRLSSDERCRKCFCSGKSDFCEAKSGFCLYCKNNTTGYSCERCMEDFIGNPRKNQPCIHKDKINATSVHSGGIIAGICIGLLLLIGGVIGFILYRRWNKFPNTNKFWTVELRDDHERVNFSALPEDEVQARRMDYDFYQDQGGNRGRDGSQKYSHLQEI